MATLVMTSAWLEPTSSQRLLVVFSILLTHLLFATFGLRQFEAVDKNDDWSAMDIWRNVTIGFIYSAFVELILVILNFFIHLN
jgi:hypothetical protein